MRPTGHQILRAPRRIKPLIGAIATWLIAATAAVGLSPAEQARAPLLRLGVADSLTKVFCDEPFGGEIADTIHVELARNEYEAAQLVLIAGNKPLQDVYLEFSDLVGRDRKATIARTNINYNYVGYTAPTAITSKEVLTNRNLKPRKPRPWPDPLLPDKTCTVEPHKTQPVWITVYVPGDAVAGSYKGTIRIMCGGKAIGQATLDVLVWDFTLPESTPLYVWYYNDFNNFARNWLAVTRSHWDDYKTAFRHYVREIARHRGSISPPLSYADGRRFEEIMQIMVEEGLEYWWVTWFWGSSFLDKSRKEQERMARQVYDYMRSKGWLDSTFFMTQDEPDLRESHREERARWKRHMAVLREAGFPKLQTDMTWRCASALSFMERYPTVWCPQFSYFERMFEKFLQEQRKEGDIIGFYLTGSGSGREPRHYIPFPLTDMRRLFYYLWRHGLTLCEFWALDITWRKVGPDPFRLVTGGGYGGGTNCLIYPNTKRDLTRPFLSSLRFEAIRDGIEDYCYLWLLDRLVKRAQEQGKGELAAIGRRTLDELSAKFGRHLTDYHLADPLDYFRARRRLAETIMKLKGPGPEVLLPKKRFPQSK